MKVAKNRLSIHFERMSTRIERMNLCHDKDRFLYGMI